MTDMVRTKKALCIAAEWLCADKDLAAAKAVDHLAVQLCSKARCPLGGFGGPTAAAFAFASRCLAVVD